jgi:germination protein M
MTRRTAASLSRLIPALLVAGALVVLGVAAGVAACGGSSGGSTPAATVTETVTATPSQTAASPSPSASATPTTISVYFLRGEKLGVAQRQVPHTAGVATAAMTALCGGPSGEERAAGLTSSVPEGTELLGVAIADGTATVDLSSEFGSGGGSLSMMSRVAQVVYTLTQYPTIRRVSFEMEGEPVDALGGEGLVLDEPQRRADWREFEPPIFVESPGVGAVLPDPFVLRGSAVVFEAQFVAQLSDSSGRRIVRVPVMASRGAPLRGTFREEIAYSTSARAGVLTVYEVSMADGSRMNVVRIPVTFAGTD